MKTSLSSRNLTRYSSRKTECNIPTKASSQTHLSLIQTQTSNPENLTLMGPKSMAISNLQTRESTPHFEAVTIFTTELTINLLRSMSGTSLKTPSPQFTPSTTQTTNFFPLAMLQPSEKLSTCSKSEKSTTQNYDGTTWVILSITAKRVCIKNTCILRLFCVLSRIHMCRWRQRLSRG